MTTNSELSADEKRFEEWNPFEYENSFGFETAKEAWQAACDYKNAEIEKLRKRIEYLTSSKLAYKTQRDSFRAELAKEKAISEKLEYRLNDLNNGVFKFYNDHYGNINWDVCCSGGECACLGKPTDPEYYVYQDIKMIPETLKEVKEMRDEQL